MIELEKGMPANLDAERFILGSIMLSGNEMFAASEAALGADDFAIEKHRRIYRAMRELDAAGKRIGTVELANELERRGELESVDGLSYLVSLDDGLPRLANIDSYVRIVHEKAVLRKIATEAEALRNRALMAEDDPQDILAHADTILARLSQRDDSQADWQDPGQVIAAYPGGFDSFVAPSRGGQGVALPWPKLNSTLCGLQAGDLMLISGRPSHGKSAAALQAALAIAKSGKGVAYFSLEMSRESIVRRLIALAAQVDSHRMRLGYLTVEERGRVSRARAEISSLPLWIDYRGYTTPAIRRALKRLKAERDIAVVVIDHFHLVQAIGREEDRQRFARTADDFQRYAKEFAIPFVVLTQLNRKAEDENRAPGLSDLKETGKLEENADIVLFVHRPEVYARNRAKPELNGIAEFIIAKQRNGPSGKIDMTFRKEFQSFSENNRQEQPCTTQ